LRWAFYFPVIAWQAICKKYRTVFLTARCTG
jgi:hypothetical protein